MNTCCTVKSVEEEINKPNAFVNSISLTIVQKLEVKGRTFYMQADNYSEKESWIGALGKAMIKTSVMIYDDMDDKYM